MASLLAIRAVLGASLGLGALDLVWINAALAPRLVQPASPPPQIATMTETASALPAEPPSAPPAPPAAAEPAAEAVQTDDIVTMRVYFDTGSATLDSRARDVLAKLADAASPHATFVLEGHADHRGSERLNRSLSKDRARSVQRALGRLGIESARVRVGYVGEREATGELWRDRRVDIQITGGTR